MPGTPHSSRTWLIGELCHPDVALLPIGGRFTMGPEEAMIAAHIGAPLVIPIHYDTWPIIRRDPGLFRDALNGPPMSGEHHLAPGESHHLMRKRNPRFSDEDRFVIFIRYARAQKSGLTGVYMKMPPASSSFMAVALNGIMVFHRDLVMVVRLPFRAGTTFQQAPAEEERGRSTGMNPLTGSPTLESRGEICPARGLCLLHLQGLHLVIAVQEVVPSSRPARSEWGWRRIKMESLSRDDFRAPVILCPSLSSPG